jgi:hypothetical protein
MSCKESTEPLSPENVAGGTRLFLAICTLEFVREGQSHVDFGESQELGQGCDFLDVDERRRTLGSDVVDGAHASGEGHGAAVKGVAVVQAASRRSAALVHNRQKAGAQPGATRGVGLEPALAQEGELAAHKAGQRRRRNRMFAERPERTPLASLGAYWYLAMTGNREPLAQLIADLRFELEKRGRRESGLER